MAATDDERLAVGTRVRVKSDGSARDYGPEAVRARQQACVLLGLGAEGEVVRVSDYHGVCYEVRFPGGRRALFDPDEVSLASEPEGSEDGVDAPLRINVTASQALRRLARGEDGESLQSDLHLTPISEVVEAGLYMWRQDQGKGFGSRVMHRLVLHLEARPWGEVQAELVRLTKQATPGRSGLTLLSRMGFEPGWVQRL